LNLSEFKNLPPHLFRYVADQNYDRYSSIDQAVWRFIMRQLKYFLSTNAHSCYIDGLRKSGISSEYIPKISEMSEKLEKYGWRTIPVSGFIPPAAFMELQSLGYLPIACDMRTLEHLGYTPAPDIVHEAAGHAPILIDPNFSKYLKTYAQVAAKAILNKEDLDIYNAIRKLSDLKENPAATPEMISEAEKELEAVTSVSNEPSEGSLLARMNWWTAEYGLIGDIENPKIYGAGLLSSVQESRSALTDKAKKIPFSLECLKYSYDITEPQPQLFVSKNFEDLTNALIEMSKTMAFAVGGISGLQKAKVSRAVNAIEYDSGLQMSGVLTGFKTFRDSPSYIQLTGPVQLSLNSDIIEGHGKEHHAQGFGAPVGIPNGFAKPIWQMTESELAAKGIEIGKPASLNFPSGVTVNGTTKSFSKLEGKILLITFENCKVTLTSEVLFDPSWGEFDMATGSKISSVFGGAANRVAYGETDDFQNIRVPKKAKSEKELHLESLYSKVRFVRENLGQFEDPVNDLEDVLENLNKEHKEDWLLRLEVLEIFRKTQAPQANVEKLEKSLKVMASNLPNFEQSILDGLSIANLAV
jgi:phenylalanine-4-hydroxylase